MASGFDTPVEQWTYSIERYTGIAHYIVCPYAKLFARIYYGKDASLSAVEGINSVDIPVLVISGTDDVFYGNESPIYKKKNQITNENCSFILKDKDKHNGHYDYFLTDEAIGYERKVANGEIAKNKIDKWLYMEHDKKFMNEIDCFMEKSIEMNITGKSER